ncbi:tetratricopeptide repeat-containing sensor histidine kinase [Tenacibaculum sp. FZY0031]|uniref:tetratricopeptide repeat-containing sensor histidine kinase n=1 Tax=Tenacibaculum sp. FZY0031 TaxID=3116648 RepID=UPI002EAF6C81|nr:tetratricopeptide repeat-containing sensor histidine kinase [Tenacibaculum sp. FZY0031]
MKYRKALTFTVLLFLCTLFSQENNKVPFSLFFKEINKLKLKEVNFTKTSHFFLKKEWDSVLVFSSKALLFNKQQNINNYIHYMRGYSFMKKKLYTESLKEYEKVNTNFPFYHKIIRNLGGISLEQRNYKKAILYFEQLNNITDAVSAYEKSSVIHDTGIAYFHLEDYKKATTNLLKAIQLQEKKQDTLLLIGSYMDIANVYYAQYKDNIAIPYFEKAYELSNKVSDFEIKRKAALNMSVVEENRKNFAKSLAYRKEFEKWKDSLTNQQKIWSVAQFEKKLAISQKQKEIDLLASQNKLKESQRNNLLISSFLLLFLLIISVYFYIQKNKNHQIITRQKEELNLLNKTKDKLFSIVSHDLRSSVDLIKRTNINLLKKIDSLKDSLLSNIVLSNITTANTTYNLLENLLNWATLQTKQLYFHQESVDLHSIIKQVEYNFIPLFKSKNISFQNQIPTATFIFADIDSLKIIIRNLLDNAVKFSHNNGIISVHSKDVDDLIQFTLKDNGIGMNKTIVNNLLKETSLLNKKRNQQEIGTGLGIQLCKTLAQKNNATFTIKSTEGKGTQVLLRFKKP